MTEEFTASNGRVVVRNVLGYLVVDQANSLSEYTFSEAQTLALREFFQHEKDQELGLWRDPEHPEYVAYPAALLGEAGTPSARVLNERTGVSSLCGREDSKLMSAAKAYFAAHPLPKPWHDAKPGEVWVVDFEAGVTEAVVVPRSGWVKSLAVVAARRIYPEN